MADWRKKYDKNHKQASKLNDKILVANWFLPEHIEGFLGCKITEKEYLEIVQKWNDSGMYDVISQEVREWVEEYGQSK